MTDAGPVVVVHGGATSRVDDAGALTTACQAAAEAGGAVMTSGGSAVDAVEVAVRTLEAEPLLNAGTGAAPTEIGTIELDASMMEGTRRRAGGVAALGAVRHPISVARAVLEHGRHVLYAGAGADAFARAAGFPAIDPAELITDRSRALLARWIENQEAPPVLDTVGAVALDADRRTAAGTSTGGMVGQEPGRVGDSPIPGAGSYADDRSGAVSTTGAGEAILRSVLAFDAVRRLDDDQDPQAAADAALSRFGEDFEGRGGLIMVDAAGRIAVSRNTSALPWAAWVAGEVRSGS